MATDFMLGVNGQNPIRCVSLASNNSALTATGNDYGYEEVFERSLSRLSRNGDLLVLISASGNSENLIRAAKGAASRGLTTVSLTGFDGGKLKGISDIKIHSETKLGDYGLAEDCHLAVNHYVKERVLRVAN
jgi:D-sedoheptulose 7-phosphate isomerase